MEYLTHPMATEEFKDQIVFYVALLNLQLISQDSTNFHRNRFDVFNFLKNRQYSFRTHTIVE